MIGKKKYTQEEVETATRVAVRAAELDVQATVNRRDGIAQVKAALDLATRLGIPENAALSLTYRLPDGQVTVVAYIPAIRAVFDELLARGYRP